MKRFISLMSVLVCLAVVLSAAPTAFASGNDLVLGNNVLKLGVEHRYTVEADGVLHLQFHEVYYGSHGGVHEGNLHRWLDFLVNGTAVNSFTNELEVSAGDVVTVQMVSRDGDDTYVAQLMLSFTEAPEGGETNLMGDVNGDGAVDTTDAKLVMQLDLGLTEEAELDPAVADVNGDGAIDTTDAKLIMQLDLGLITEFPGIT